MPLRGKIWPLAVIVLVAGMLATWQWVLRAAPVSYGAPSKTYFKPAAAAEGEEIELCFDDLVWFRLCRGTLVTQFTPARGARIDLPSYTISTPAATGRVPPKCRKWTVPKLGPDREAGGAVLGGFASFECGMFDHWSPLVVNLPTIRLHVKK